MQDCLLLSLLEIVQCTSIHQYNNTVLIGTLDIFNNLLALTFQIEDTARKNLTRLKKGINFWARVIVVRSKHKGI